MTRRIEHMKRRAKSGDDHQALSALCLRSVPKQAKGNIKSWKATPMQLVNGDEVLTLKFELPPMRDARHWQNQKSHTENAVTGKRSGIRKWIIC
ncbi:hypothetical protein ACNKHM_27710 [Shigella sonnei]